MSTSCLMKLMAGSVVLAAIGYLLGGMLSLTPAIALALGLLAGSMVGGVATALYSKSVSGDTEAEAEGGSCNIYVGNLPFNIGKDEIKNLFAPYGQVIEIRMVKDRRSRRFKGYAFVEMNRAPALAAIKQLDGTDYAGRTLRVNEARSKDDA